MANLKLNIQRFDGGDTRLDYNPNETQSFIGALQPAVQSVESGILTITQGIDQLVKDWGDERADEHGNQFNQEYKNLIRSAMEYVNSIGLFARDTANAFANQYGIGTSYNYNPTDISKEPDDFQKTNSNGLTGPVSDGIDQTFLKSYNSGMEKLNDALKQLKSALEMNPNAFTPDIEEAASNTINEENAKFQRAIEATSRAYYDFLAPYISEAMSLNVQGSNAAAGAGSN